MFNLCFIKFYYNGHIKKDEVSGASREHDENEKCTYVKEEAKRILCG
jgi:hypothetical protein